MKYTLHLLVLLVLSSVKAMGAPTPYVVENFYKTMGNLCKTTDERTAYDYRSEIMDCFKGREDGGIPVPNDFYSWGYDKENRITANTYSLRFYDLSYKQGKINSYTYKVERSDILSEIELEKYKNQPSGLVRSIVKKTFSDGKITKTFSDTLIVENGKIVIFKNAVYNDDSANVDIEALRALAANYYSSKQYYNAYKTYEKIIKHDPKNGNAYYRLALLTFFQKGCSYNKKISRKLAIEYAEEAKRLGFDKAESALYYFTIRQAI